MKVCVVGAGAIGGYMAVHIANAGHEVSVIARGPHLAAIKDKGLMLIESESEFVADKLVATNDIKELGSVDVVLLALKAHQISPIVNDLSMLLGKDTVVVTLQNGIPWWYFQNFEGKHSGLVVESVDPGGVLFHNMDPDRIIGCIAYPATTIEEPGVIKHIEGNRFPVGELNGQETARVQRVSQLFTESGFRARILDDIRSEIWLKLWGNLTFNPISALTHSTLIDICQFDLTRDLVAKMMKEAQVVGESLGAHFRVPIEKRISGAEMVGKHKTSMLQDVEAAKPIEIGGLVGSVLELGSLLGIPMPYTNTVYACTKLLAQKIIVGTA